MRINFDRNLTEFWCLQDSNDSVGRQVLILHPWAHQAVQNDSWNAKVADDTAANRPLKGSQKCVWFWHRFGSKRFSFCVFFVQFLFREISDQFAFLFWPPRSLKIMKNTMPRSIPCLLPIFVRFWIWEHLNVGGYLDYVKYSSDDLEF